MGDIVSRPETIICDIDGVIFMHHGDITQQHLIKPVVLPGVIKTFQTWDLKGCALILITGRRESTRAHTERQLAEAGIIYDTLVMGVTGGRRVLINDGKADKTISTTYSLQVERNVGL